MSRYFCGGREVFPPYPAPPGHTWEFKGCFAGHTSFWKLVPRGGGSPPPVPIPPPTVPVPVPAPSIPAPIASFTHRLYAHGLVAFTDTSLNNPTAYLWGFGDGRTSTLKNPFHIYTSAGTRTVTLAVQNSGGINSTSRQVNVVILPEYADFTHAVGGLKVFITDTSTVLGTTFRYDFGDGSTSTVPNPIHTYAVAGTYLIRQTVNGTFVRERTISVAVPIGWQNVVWMNLVNCHAYPNSNDLRKNAGVTRAWDAGAISTVSIDSAIAGAGIQFKLFYDYAVAAGLSANNPDQGLDTIDFCIVAFSGDMPGIQIRERGVTKFNDYPYDYNSIYRIIINSSGRIEYWVNPFVQGNYTGWTLLYTSLNVPSFPLFMDTSITVSGPVTGIGEAQINAGALLAEANLPVASFTTNVNSGIVPLTVQFTDTSTGTPTTWRWEWGDGTADGTIQNPSHTFTTAGQYTVRLTVANAYGTSSFIRTIRVNSVQRELPAVPPIASFTASARIVAPNTTVNFTDTSTGGEAVSWSWRIDGVQFATTQNSSHLFTDIGIYNISLTVADITGLSSIATQAIIVAHDTDPIDNRPVATIISDKTTGFAPTTITFSATVSTPNVFYLWDFGDGTTSTSASVSHTYTRSGIYTVTLTVTNLYGSTRTTMTIIIVDVRYADSSVIGYYIIDRANHRILMYGRNGALIGAFGEFGTGVNQFNTPTSLLVNRG